MFSETNLIGRVGNDPEIRAFSDGGKIAHFSLATTETWKDKSGARQERTEWHRIVIRGRLVDIVESYVKKGMMLFVKGANRTRKYTGNDNIERYTTEVAVHTLKMLDKRDDANSYTENPALASQGAAMATQNTNPYLDDDLPF